MFKQERWQQQKKIARDHVWWKEIERYKLKIGHALLSLKYKKNIYIYHDRREKASNPPMPANMWHM